MEASISPGRGTKGGIELRGGERKVKALRACNGPNSHMFRRVMIAALAAGALAPGLLTLGACAPITSYSGFQTIDADPAKDVKVGADTKSTARAKLGSPSATSTFDPNVWFYMNQM